MSNYMTVEDIIVNLATLSDQVYSLKKEIASTAQISVDSQDARLVALDAIQRCFTACAHWMHADQSLFRICKNSFPEGIWQKEYAKLLGAKSPEMLDAISYNMEDYLRNSLATRVHFHIDNLFNNLKIQLGNQRVRNMVELTKSTLELAGLRREGSEFQILTILRSIRNSYHNNGLHRGEDDLHLEIDGMKFDFERGKQITCASWKHLLVLMKSTITILREILLSSRVSSIKSVTDDFASTPPTDAFIAGLMNH